MTTDTRIPVCLLTGFLGAGKTTLLNALLRDPAMVGTGVVINEYGTVGIDHHLVEAAPEDTSLIADGCICCTARGEIAEAMLSLSERMQARAGTSLRRVIIETTGLAEPWPILQQILRTPELAERYTLDSVVTVVDAFNVADTLATQDIAVQQITAADRILISKTDLVDSSQSAELRARLAQMNPDAEINDVAQGAAQPEQLFTGGRHDPSSPQYRPGALLANADTLRFTPAPPGVLRRQPGLAVPRDQDIQTFSLILDVPLQAGRFLGWMEFLRTLCGPTLLRVKGLINIDGQTGPTVIHGVQKAFHPPTELAAWPDDDRRTRLVFITRGYGQEIVGETLGYLQACAAGQPATPPAPSRPIQLN
ncbi:MAG: GTP-binding protein [Hydrocarboniphaga sp.]|uniref:CobW family GTP-binding protein n=1 Tax=Hydrocarboniphaga sp. TaxID=2033016 RepID=UPI002616D3BD|nr:GTP-binding protein [Hydrocarboniphaga sp.]MDB5971786.1 GTP-binding protein [Hydrocarboniphaga sp.]